MNSQDSQILQTLLGMEELPDDVVRECEMRCRWYHSCGAGGGIGPLALIDMLRFLGYERKPDPAAPVVVDWGRMPSDGSVLVEARHDRSDTVWFPGVYLGFISAGTLAIKTGDGAVVECKRINVRLPYVVSESPPQITDVASAAPPQPELDETIEYIPAVQAVPEYFEGQMVTVPSDDGSELQAIVSAVDGDEVLVRVRGDESDRLYRVSDVSPL